MIIILIQPHLVPKIPTSRQRKPGPGGGCGPALPSRLSFHHRGDKTGRFWRVPGHGIINPLGLGFTGASPPSATKPTLPITLPDPVTALAPRAAALPRCPSGGTVPKPPPLAVPGDRGDRAAAAGARSRNGHGWAGTAAPRLRAHGQQQLVRRLSLTSPRVAAPAWRCHPVTMPPLPPPPRHPARHTCGTGTVTPSPAGHPAAWICLEAKPLLASAAVGTALAPPPPRSLSPAPHSCDTE